MGAMNRMKLFHWQYRGFATGYVQCDLPGSIFGHYTGCWKSSMDAGWHTGCVYKETLEEVPKLIRDIIDYNYRIEAKEFELGRKLTMSEIHPERL